jgi:hypothetical protein
MQGDIPLVIDVVESDIIATLVELKREIEAESGPLKVTLSGATEAHLVAKQLGEAGIGVIVTEPRPFPHSWEEKDM